MANISGRVVFDVDRTGAIDGSDTGLSNIPVVLQNISNGLRLTVLTDINGDYTFTDVPDGDYRVVEAYGTLGGVLTPGSFLTAIVGPIPVGDDPVIGVAVNPPPTATDIDSLTPNTLNVTISGADLVDQNFLDGPVLYTPITDILDACATLDTTNLIIAANGGDFGSFPAGTAVETGANPNPYPGLSSGFSYIIPNPPGIRPIDGTYTIQNILTNMVINASDTWWRIADHTTGDETGRLQAIGGANPGVSFFQSSVGVSLNTNYLFSAWITNLIRNPALAEPLLGVEILDQNGIVIYNQTLGNLIPANTVQPEWKEIGTGLNSGNNTSLTVRFISQGPAAIGNDFAIDDIAFREIFIPDIEPQKSSSRTYADLGDFVTYTVVLNNPCDNPLTNVNFIDTVQSGLTFVADSVTIDGVSSPGLDPSVGFTVPDILGNDSVIIEYTVEVTSIPNPNTVQNIANMTYDYTPVQGGIPVTYSKDSNPVDLTINSADISIDKSADREYAKSGDIINYTIVVQNDGNVEANPAIVTDLIPVGTTYVPNSLVIDGSASNQNIETGIDLSGVLPGETNIITFKVIVDENVEFIPITNTANITYEYVVDPTAPKKEVSRDSNTVNIELIKLEALKVASAASININDTLTYTITVTNKGSVDLDNVVITDVIPEGAVYVTDTFSVDGSIVPGANPEAGVNIGTILVSQSVEIEFDILLQERPCINSLVNKAEFNYEFTLPSTGEVITEMDESNTIVTEIQTNSFKQLEIDSTVTIPEAKPDIENIIGINVDIEICSYSLIDTPIGLSNEGQNLSGKKLIVCGNIKEKIEYVGLVTTQSVHSAHFNIPFCVHIVMEETFDDCCRLFITAYIEDIYYKALDSRNVFTNITFRIETGQ